MKSTKKQLKERVIQMEEKYFRLVWFARKNEDVMLVLTDDGVQENKIVLDKMHEIQMQFPIETQELLEEETDWTHGFNSGMLAGMRYVWEMMEHGQESADEEFPFLDT